MLSAQISGRITAVKKQVGDTFRAGETLVSFDCTPFEARVAAREAVVDAARTTLDSTEQMFRLKSVGKHDVELADAELRKVEAELAIQRYDAQNCLVPAPFDGRVTEVTVNPHESVKVGAGLIEILDHRDLELEILVPSPWLRWLAKGSHFSVLLDATGQEHYAEVVRIGAEVDAASQSVQVYGRFVGGTQGVLSGMSGDVSFPGMPPRP